MFFLGQPVLPLICFFSIRKFRPPLLRNVRKDTALCQEASSWLDAPFDRIDIFSRYLWWHWWGRRKPPSKAFGFGKLNIYVTFIILYLYDYMYTLIFISIYNIHNSTCISTKSRERCHFFQMSSKTTSEAKRPWRRWSETWRPSNISPATWDTTAPGPSGVTVFTGMKGRQG